VKYALTYRPGDTRSFEIERLMVLNLLDDVVMAQGNIARQKAQAEAQKQE
jgi:hypothetical protein